MYEQYVLDLLSDVFFGGACLSFCESLPLILRNPALSFWKSQISHLEIPDLSLWKIRTS